MMRRIEVTMTAALLAACGPDKDPSVTTDPTGLPTTTEGDDTDPVPTDPSDPTEDPDPSGGGAVNLEENSEVDILFVIDNSGSMAEEQQRMAESAGALIDALAGLDYRVGFTTTDAGNPRCANTTPENGNLQLTSCLDRVSAGEFMTADGDFSEACTANCARSDAELSVLPTTTESDDNAAPRKWIESTAGSLNIAGVSAVEAMQCYLPQGVTGCGFESHLESMYKALAAAQDQNSKNNYGFRRSQSTLAIVFVSDETDCSYAPDKKEIFIDNKTFWWSPDDPAPTSSMCWDAGVACSGAAPVYDECHAENHDLSGAPGSDDAEAVLQPLSKYIGFVQTIEDQKKNFALDAEVLVAMIAGVPGGYESFAAEIPYRDSMDFDYMSRFGIGPGCIVGPIEAPSATAVPPVREREFAEAFAVDERRDVWSICDEDYAGALAGIGEAIRGQMRPLCYPLCAADSAPGGLFLPECTVHEYGIEGTETPVAACVDMGGKWAAPAGETVCYAVRVDVAGATPSPLDDIAEDCSDRGYNVQFEIVRAAAKPAGSSISASCVLSDDEAKDCPLL